MDSATVRQEVYGIPLLPDPTISQGLTEEEVMERWGNIPLDFHSYNKFFFFFEGYTPDGIRIIGRYGGTPDKIKGFHLLASPSRSLSQFQMREWDHLLIKDIEGKVLFVRKGEEERNNGNTNYSS